MTNKELFQDKSAPHGMKESNQINSELESDD